MVVISVPFFGDTFTVTQVVQQYKDFRLIYLSPHATANPSLAPCWEPRFGSDFMYALRMPVLYGHQSMTENETNMSDITQFTKWFHLNDMDFQLSNTNGQWKCMAWKRGCGALYDGSPSDYWSSGQCSSMVTAMLRCYEAIRHTQRKGL